MPCSILTTIISTEMMASSTSSPRAIINAPREMRCKSMPATSIARKVIASTKGIDSATTKPVRSPKDRKLTASTMPIASARVFMNSLTEWLTTLGWSDTAWMSMPFGRLASSRAISARNCRPSSKISPPLTMETIRPMASCPWKRNRCVGGSA